MANDPGDVVVLRSSDRHSDMTMSEEITQAGKQAIELLIPQTPRHLDWLLSTIENERVQRNEHAIDVRGILGQRLEDGGKWHFFLHLLSLFDTHLESMHDTSIESVIPSLQRFPEDLHVVLMNHAIANGTTFHVRDARRGDASVDGRCEPLVCPNFAVVDWNGIHCCGMECQTLGWGVMLLVFDTRGWLVVRLKKVEVVLLLLLVWMVEGERDGVGDGGGGGC